MLLLSSHHSDLSFALYPSLHSSLWSSLCSSMSLTPFLPSLPSILPSFLPSFHPRPIATCIIGQVWCSLPCLSLVSCYMLCTVLTKFFVFRCSKMCFFFFFFKIYFIIIIFAVDQWLYSTQVKTCVIHVITTIDFTHNWQWSASEGCTGAVTSLTWRHQSTDLPSLSVFMSL